MERSVVGRRVVVAMGFAVVVAACVTPNSVDEGASDVPTSGVPESIVAPSSVPSTSAVTESTPATRSVSVGVVQDGEWTAHPYPRLDPYLLWVVYGLGVDHVVEVPSGKNGGLARGAGSEIHVTLRLREGARWSDGIPVTGADLAFSLEMTMDGCTSPLNRTTTVGDVDILEVGEDYLTVEMSGKWPTDFLILTLLPARVFEDRDPCDLSRDVLVPTTGPYSIARLAPDRMELVANPYYLDWEFKPDERVEELELRFYPDEQTAVEGWRSEEVDVLAFDLDADQRSELLAAGVDEGSLPAVPGDSFLHLDFQFGDQNPNQGSLNRVREFRHGVAHAIDRESLRDLMSPQFAMAEGFADNAWARFEYDPDTARSLIASACESVSRDCSESPPSIEIRAADADETYVRAVAEMLTEVGLDVRLDLGPPDEVYGSDFDLGRWDTMVFSWAEPSRPSYAFSLAEVVDPDGSHEDGNHQGWVLGEVDGPNIATADRLLEIMHDTLEPDRALAALDRYEQVLAEEMVLIPLGSPYRTLAVREGSLEIRDDMRFGILANVHKWSFDRSKLRSS